MERKRTGITGRWFRRSVAVVLAVLVFFSVAYTLIVPSISIERTAVCGKPEHLHNSNCYAEDGTLICGKTEHIHTASCYTKRITVNAIRPLPMTTAGEDVPSNTQQPEFQEPEMNAETDVQTQTQTAPAQESVPEQQHDQDEIAIEPDPETTQTDEDRFAPVSPTFFSASTGDLNVYVTAQEGSFPAGTSMRARLVTQDEVQQTVDAVSEVGTYVTAVDITFMDAQGREIQPTGPIQVEILGSKISEVENPMVTHLDGSAGGSEVKTLNESSGVSFEADHFSIYMILEKRISKTLTTEGDTYTVTVKCGPEAEVPDDAELCVREILPDDPEYSDYYEQTVAATETAVHAARFFDITILSGGVEIQPKAPVAVSIAYKETQTLQENSAIETLHFGDEQVEKILSTAKKAENTLEEVRFDAASFSVYAVVEGGTEDEARATVNFYNGETLISTVYVKNSDDADAIETIVFDPGAGTVPNGQIFQGWSISTKNTTDGADYTTTSTRNTIADVRAYLRNLEITEGDVVNIYAMIYKTYTITYVGEENVSLGSDQILLLPNGAEADYTVNMNYTPSSDTYHFEGWNVTSGSDKINSATYNGSAVSAPYPNGTALNVEGDVTLSVYAPLGHWLVFKENGKGATYNAPQFVVAGSVTQRPVADAQMQRLGYTFGGWFTDEACTAGNEFSFGSELTENTTLYAKWTKVPTANYTIIIWKQNITGNGYDYEDSMRLSGATNTTINTVSQQGSGNNAYARINGTAYRYDGFSLKEFDQNVTIAPEGNAVVNVYFDRNEYTLSFQVNGAYTYDPATDDTTRPQFGLVNGEYVELDAIPITSEQTIPYSGTRYNITNVRANNNPQHYGVVAGRNAPVALTRRDNNRWYYDSSLISWGTRYYGEHYIIANNGSYGFVDGEMVPLNADGTYTVTNTIGYRWLMNGEDYDGARFVRSYHSGWTTVKEITALYEQSIADQFPIVGTNGVVYNSGERWDPQANQQGWSEVMVFIDIMPPESITFRLDEANRPLKTMYYYVEALDGATGTVTHKGTQYTLYNTIYARYNGVTAEDYIELSGFTKRDVAGSPGGNTLVPDGNGFYIYNDTQNQSIYFFYSRDAYNINYMDGTYFDGNGNPIDDETDRGQLKVVSNVSYGSDLTSYGRDGTQYFEPEVGEYTFAGWYIDQACTQEYQFTTMPKGGVTVYAKWIQNQYRVFLHPNVPEADTSLDWGDDNQSMNFRVSSGSTVSVPTGLRTQYELMGWYLDEACTEIFNAEAFILNDSTVTTPYDKSVDMTDDMNKWGNIITGTGSNSDATGYNGGDRFWITKKLDLYAKWRAILIGADGIGVQYDVNGGTNPPTDSTLYLDQAEAVAQAASTAPDSETQQFLYWVVQQWDETQGKYVDTNKHVFPGDTFTVLLDNARDQQDPNDPAKHTYTVQLRAEYGDKEAETPTHIYWYPNNVDITGAPIVTTLQVDTSRIDSGVYDVPYTQERGYFGTDNLQINEAVNIAGADIYSYPGYEFVGWSRVPVTSGDEKPWLVYENGHFRMETHTVTKVAADEEQPYHDLYAMWRKLPQVSVIKTDSDDAAVYLAGAQFTLYKGEAVYPYYTDPACTDATKVADGKLTSTNTAQGVTLYGLTPGTYRLVETVAPDGYLISASEITFRVYVAADGTYQLELMNNPVNARRTGATGIIVTNPAGKPLPQTGGRGNLPFLLGGGILILASTTMFSFRKRRQERRQN